MPNHFLPFLEKSSGKPLVVVDWHNTLEVDNDVSGRNAYALTMLLQRAEVVLLSYVNTRKSEQEVMADMKQPGVAGNLENTFKNCAAFGFCVGVKTGLKPANKEPKDIWHFSIFFTGFAGPELKSSNYLVRRCEFGTPKSFPPLPNGRQGFDDHCLMSLEKF